MNLLTVANEIRTALDTVTGLVVPAWGEKASSTPAALVAWPVQLNFTTTYGRGKAQAPDWPVIVVVGAPSSRGAHTKLSGFLADSGAGSVLAALETGPYTACDFVHVDYAEIDPDARYAGNPVLAAILHCNVVGPGK